MKPAFRAGAVHVRVPATSANLGPGFDAVGLALSLHDDVVARVGDDGLAIDIAGEGAELPRDDTHLVVRSMRAAFDRLGGQPRGIELTCTNRIPHSRGLGSSAAAIIAGLVLARALVLDGERALPEHELLALAGEIEGHPDNVAACLLGGLTLAWTDGGASRAVRLDCDPAIRPVALVPPFSASDGTGARAAAGERAARRRRVHGRAIGIAGRRPHRLAGGPRRRDRGPSAPAVSSARDAAERRVGSGPAGSWAGRGHLGRGTDGARPGSR